MYICIYHAYMICKRSRLKYVITFHQSLAASLKGPSRVLGGILPHPVFVDLNLVLRTWYGNLVHMYQVVIFAIILAVCRKWLNHIQFPYYVESTLSKFDSWISLTEHQVYVKVIFLPVKSTSDWPDWLSAVAALDQPFPWVLGPQGRECCNQALPVRCRGGWCITCNWVGIGSQHLGMMMGQQKCSVSTGRARINEF